MFVWMKLKGVEDATRLIMTEAVEKKVCVCVCFLFLCASLSQAHSY